jgi:hypothetical protein
MGQNKMLGKFEAWERTHCLTRQPQETHKKKHGQHLGMITILA